MVSNSKIVQLSAALSLGLVAAAALGGAFAAGSGKPYPERLVPSAIEPGAARLSASPAAAAADCAGQTWPNIDPACIGGPEEPPRRQIRTITIEQRGEGNVSRLVRVESSVLAQR